MIKNTQEFMDFLKDQLAQPANCSNFQQLSPSNPLSLADVRSVGISFLILGLCLVVNVLLNLRLLRWYYLVKKSDVS